MPSNVHRNPHFRLVLKTPESGPCQAYLPTEPISGMPLASLVQPSLGPSHSFILLAWVSRHFRFITLTYLKTTLSGKALDPPAETLIRADSPQDPGSLSS
jgi:hypothetical protein